MGYISGGRSTHSLLEQAAWVTLVKGGVHIWSPGAGCVGYISGGRSTHGLLEQAAWVALVVDAIHTLHSYHLAADLAR